MFNNKFKIITAMASLAVFTLCVFLYKAADAKQPTGQKLRSKLSLRKPDLIDQRPIGVNNWNYALRNDGSYMQDNNSSMPGSGGAGGEFPRGSQNYIVYAGGFYVGTQKGGVPVVSEVEFATEFQPGRILDDGVPFANLTAEDPVSPSLRVYLIDRSQAGDDWDGWADVGGPLTSVSTPALIADGQTFSAFNDLNTNLSQEGQVQSPNPGLGLQVDLETFTFSAGVLANVVFMKFTIENKTDGDYPNTYVGIWQDPDVNTAQDDAVGVDVSRGLGLAYDCDEATAPFAAVGLDFFQGPLVSSGEVSADLVTRFSGNNSILVYDAVENRYKPTDLAAGMFTLGATQFAQYQNGGGDPNDNNERYNYLQGFAQQGGPRDAGRVDPAIGPYDFSGDPITNTGLNWSCPGTDQRMMHGSGPFTLKAGEPQEIWVGIIGSNGTDQNDAIAKVREIDDIAQETFTAGLIAPIPPNVPKVSVTPLDGKVAITWDNSSEFTEDIAGEVLGISIADGFSADYLKRDFQGYRLYKSRTGLPGSFTMIGQWDIVDGFGTVNNLLLNANGVLEVQEINVGTNTGLQYSFVDESVTNGQVYFYSVTAFDAQPYISTGDVIPGHPVVEPTAVGKGVAIVDVGINNIRALDAFNFVNDPSYRSDGLSNGLVGDSLTRDFSDGLGNTDWYVESEVDFTYDTSNVNIGDVFTRLTTGTYPSQFGNFTLATNIRYEVKPVNVPSQVFRPSGLPISLETAQTANVVSAVPMAAIAGSSYDASVGVISHSAGPSDGRVEISIVDPNKISAANYAVTFFNIPNDSLGGTLVDVNGNMPADGVAWQLLKNGVPVQFTNRTIDDPTTFYDVDGNGEFNAGDVPLDERFVALNQGSDANTNTQLPVIADGMSIVVFGAALNIKNVELVSDGATPVTPPSNIYQVTSPDGNWTISAAGGDNSIAARWLRYIQTLVPFDLELRFGAGTYNEGTQLWDGIDATGGWSYHGFSDGNVHPIPVQVWNIGIATPNDPSDDYRMIPFIFENGTSAPAWHMNSAGITGYNGLPESDWIYCMVPTGQHTTYLSPTPGTAGYDAFEAAAIAQGEGTTGTATIDPLADKSFQGAGTFVYPLGRVGLYNVGGSTIRTLPAGTVIRINTNKPNSTLDQFTFSPSANTVLTAKKQLKSTLQDIKTVPNPYYGRSLYQGSIFTKVVKFVNLPATCTIKIFTVSGDLIRTLQHNSSSFNDRTNTNPLGSTNDNTDPDNNLNSNLGSTSVEIWDLKNEQQDFIASGMYVALIDAPGIGKVTKKLAIIMEEVRFNGPDIR